MKILEKISLKKSLYIFVGLTILNLIFSLGIFITTTVPQFKKEAKDITNYALKNIEEKDIKLKITKNEFEISPGEVLFNKKDFPIDFGKENLLFISKDANYADFNSKQTLAILNSKELVLNIDGNFQNYVLADFIGDKEVYIDSNNSKKYVEDIGIEGSRFTNTLIGIYSFERALFYISQFVWGYLILAFAVFYLLKLSGYSPDKNFIRSLGVLFYGVFMIFEPIISFLKFEFNFIHLFTVGFLFTAFVAKKSLDN